VLLVALALANFVSETDALLSGGMLGVRIRAPASAPGRVCSVPAAGCRQGGLLALVERRGRPLLRLAMSEDPLQSGEKREDDRVEERKTESKEKEDEFAGLDESQKKFKAAAIRKEAMDLDAAAAGLRKNAVEQEQEAAKLRIQAWKLEGGVSAVTKQITVTDKYQKQLAELDLMAEDWVDTDEEKWEWYQQQRKMIIDMIGAQQDYDEKAEESLQDLKETLLELQETLDIQTVLPNGDITSAGWGFVLLSVVIPAWFGYEIFLWATSASDAVGSLMGVAQDPFAGL